MEVTPPKKRKRRASDECEEMKSTKAKVAKSVKAMSQLAVKADKIECVFHEDHCIPLWPQYKLTTNGSNYLKVAPYELWLVQYVGWQRKVYRKD